MVFLIVAGLGLGFFILLSLPNPTVTTIQSVVPGDTVAVYYVSKTEIPQGGDRIWYESLTIGFDDSDAVLPGTSVLVFFTKASYNSHGSEPCSPREDNVHTISTDGTIELNETNGVALTKPFYLTVGATLSLNFTISSSPEDAVLRVAILEDIEKYKCLSDQMCSLDNPKSFNVSTGTQLSLSETVSVSSYYYVVFSSTESIGLTYMYEATSHYYNHTDYSDRILVSCNITQGKACTLNIVGNYGECAFVYTAPGDTDLILLNVVAHHRRFNIISIVFLALFVASLSLLVACVFSVVLLKCFERRNRKYGYNTLM